jgi:hypothetical protein
VSDFAETIRHSADRLPLPTDPTTLQYVAAWMRQRVILDGADITDVLCELAQSAPQAVELYHLVERMYERSGVDYEPGVVTCGYLQRFVAERRG